MTNTYTSVPNMHRREKGSIEELSLAANFLAWPNSIHHTDLEMIRLNYTTFSSVFPSFRYFIVLTEGSLDILRVKTTMGTLCYTLFLWNMNKTNQIRFLFKKWKILQHWQETHKVHIPIHEGVFMQKREITV